MVHLIPGEWISMICCRTREICLYILVMILALLVIAAPAGAWTAPTPTPTPTPSWYDCGWWYRKTITVDKAKVARTQDNFPVLINLASDPDLAAHARGDGNDILFTLPDGSTKLSSQIESYTGSTGALVARVLVPTLSSSSNTVLYLYYGNPGASNRQNAANVWSDGYKGAWHLQAEEKVRDHSKCRIPAPPVAAFTADVTSGKAPLTVTFTDLSTNKPTSWSWKFGDGGTSTEQNPTHTYSAGTYTVTLTATNGDGSDKKVKKDYITVFKKTLPVTDFSASPTSGKQPLTVTFTDLSTNKPTSWSWKFGDGGTSNLQNPVHVYTAAGTYTVTLTTSSEHGSDKKVKKDDCDESDKKVKKDDCDESDTVVKANYITVNPGTPPVAGFSASPTTGKEPLPVQFTDASSNAETWSWDFGDGSPVSTEQNPTHTYSAGTYTVTLTVSNGDRSDKIVKSDYITVCSEDSHSLVTTGSGETAGCIAITHVCNEECQTNTVSVTYTMAYSYCLKSADLALGWEEPGPFLLTFSQAFDDPSTCTNSYPFNIPLEGTRDQPDLYIIAHGVVQNVTSGNTSDVVVLENPIYYYLLG
jgi:PKD repeat protein